MSVFRVCLLVYLAALISASPTNVSSDRDEKSEDLEDDPIEFLKEAAYSFFNSFFESDNVQATEDVQVTRNSYRASEANSRSTDYDDKIENYIRSHDVTFKLPLVGSVKVNSRNLDNDELDFSLKISDKGVEEGRTSKIKKILTPILVFVLLKAITVVPLALGVLLLQAWNALQLSFFSFITASGLAIFQLCKKIAENNAHPPIAAHGPWEAPAHQHLARSIDGGKDDVAQKMAYSAYLQ